MKRVLAGFGLFLLLGIMAGCASGPPINTHTASGAFALAQRYEKDGRYNEAISKYSDVKNKFPYSRFAVEAALKIADLQFKEEDYVSAESSYRLFKEFHPNYSKIDYVTFRIGLSVFKQLPPTIDRDLSLADTAIKSFNDVVVDYPTSKYAGPAKKYIEKCRKMLAEKDKYIADYYYGQGIWISALGRYRDLLRHYPHQGFGAQALYGATMSAYHMKDLGRAKMYFKRLLGEYPKSSEIAKARKEISNGF